MKAIVIVFLLAGSVPAYADRARPPLPTDATLVELIDQSLAARPELHQARTLVEAENLRVPQAGALPDPVLQLGWQNDSFSSITIGEMENSYVSVMVSQTFPWAGKRGLREDVAALEAAQAGTAVSRLQLSTEAEVRRTYLGLLLARDRLALLDQLDIVWQKSLGAARSRLESGSGAQSDLLRAQLEITRIKQRRIALRLEEVSRTQALNRLRVHSLDEPIPTSTHVGDLGALAAYADGFSSDEALARSPELVAARLGVGRAGKIVALAKKAYYPDLDVGAGIMVRGQLPPMWLVTVGGSLPAFAGRKQRRAVDESRSRDRAARDEVQTIEQVVRLRTAERHAGFLALVETIDLYDQGLLIQSAATAESTLSQYTVGKVTFASVLEANAGFIADQEAYLQAVVTAHLILIAQAEVSLDPTSMEVGGAAASAMPGTGASAMAGPSARNDAGASASAGTTTSGM